MTETTPGQGTVLEHLPPGQTRRAPPEWWLAGASAFRKCWTLRVADEVTEMRPQQAWKARRALLKRVAEEAAVFARAPPQTAGLPAPSSVCLHTTKNKVAQQGGPPQRTRAPSGCGLHAPSRLQ